MPGGAAFVVLVLAGVTFDGLLETPLWLEIVRLTPVTQTLGVILLPLLFFGIYLGFVELSRIFGGGGEAGFRQFAITRRARNVSVSAADALGIVDRGSRAAAARARPAAPQLLATSAS